MEKCSYCLQRVQNGKIGARNEGRKVEDGEIQSACQVACPTQAIVFGDLKDPATRVSRLQRDPRNYAMLEELTSSHVRCIWLEFATYIRVSRRLIKRPRDIIHTKLARVMGEHS